MCLYILILTINQNIYFQRRIKGKHSSKSINRLITKQKLVVNMLLLTFNNIYLQNFLRHIYYSVLLSDRKIYL